ncbi:MAG: DinB family protein [Pseudoclavibacter sp.]
MGFLPPKSTTEHDTLATFLEQQAAQLRVSALDLTDEQARLAPVASSLSIAGLLTHGAQVIAAWLERVRVAPEDVGMPELVRLGDELGLGDGMYSGQELPELTLDQILEAYDRAVARIRPTIEGADLEARVPIPDAPWFPADLDSWNVRWVCNHIIAEVARHAGHADIIREAIDGEISYSLNARADGETFDMAAYLAE